MSNIISIFAKGNNDVQTILQNRHINNYLYHLQKKIKKRKGDISKISIDEKHPDYHSVITTNSEYISQYHKEKNITI